MDAWRFDPAAVVAAVNLVVRAGPQAKPFLRERITEAANLEEAMSATIAARIALAPVPVHGIADTFRPDAPALPHHPFVLSQDLPFLPTSALEAGGAAFSPADLVEACFRQGKLRPTPLEPGPSVEAALSLLASEAWAALIAPEAMPRASRMVRWQAVRATGRTDLLAGFEPAIATASRFEEWWDTALSRL